MSPRARSRWARTRFRGARELQVTSGRRDIQRERRPWGIAWGQPIAYSILEHELVHAIVANSLGNRYQKLAKVWHEFIAYAASKGAINSMTIGLAKEVGNEGIRVNAVEPGLIETEIHEAAGPPGRLARLVPSVPLEGRAGTAEEVAGPVLFLMSDAASYMTGAIIRVGGGR